ncbi:MAG: ADP-ribosylglycohydrolase family protein [Prevotella sp.]|nr:ADP-ribosylglycohydrolase family protein [Prevotella sp.]
MLGALVGDIIGSTYEFYGTKRTDFELFEEGCRFTDDSVMTLAVAKWLVEDKKHTTKMLIKCMQELGQKHPGAGYGGLFYSWLYQDDPQPYNSWGNGAGMRVSPVGLYGFDVSCQGSVPEAIIAFLEGNSFEEVIRLAISLGGDSDTIGCMAGAIAACMYPIPNYIAERCNNLLTDDLREIKDQFMDMVEEL